MTPLAISRKGI